MSHISFQNNEDYKLRWTPDKAHVANLRTEHHLGFSIQACHWWTNTTVDLFQSERMKKLFLDLKSTTVDFPNIEDIAGATRALMLLHVRVYINLGCPCGNGSTLPCWPWGPGFKPFSIQTVNISLGVRWQEKLNQIWKLRCLCHQKEDFFAVPSSGRHCYLHLRNPLLRTRWVRSQYCSQTKQ